MHMRYLIPALTGLAILAQRPLQVDDLFKVKRVADPQVSATGTLAYQVAFADPIANKISTKIWLKAAGSEPRELDLGPGNQSRPRFSPDGKRLAYQAGGQIWILDLASGAKRQLTQMSGGASNQVWSPDGNTLAFLSTTVLSGVEAEHAAHLKAEAERKMSGRHIKSLMYRHLQSYRDPKQYSHLFVVKVDGSEPPRDLTAGLAQDVPDFGGTAEGDGFDWAPDGERIAFGSHPEAAKAVSTNGEIYEVSLGGGPLTKLTTNPAMDNTPRYSPDGKYLSWRAQRRPVYEADRWELWVMDRATGKVVSTTEKFDGHVSAYTWNGSALLFEAGEKAQQPLFKWEMGKTPVSLTKRLRVEAFSVYPGGTKALIQSSNSAQPAELYDLDLTSGAPTVLTSHNAALNNELKLNRAEDLWTKGAPMRDGKVPDVHGLVLKPVGFDPAKKYPVAFVVHGGPQGDTADSWHYRWNLQSWAGRGFLVVAPNFRGSTGFGQTYTDQINGDWGGKPISDMMAVLNTALKAYPNADPKKVVACGGSYGGYAINWLSTHHADRFAAFVSHAGIWNTESMQVASEESWFPKWEFKGFPWESPATKALWAKHSPHNSAQNLKKPMLVTHGEMDYRVVYTEALQLFNTLQLKGVPSELIVFPDENHFVLKPANSKQWYTAVMDWCEKWTM